MAKFALFVIPSLFALSIPTDVQGLAAKDYKPPNNAGNSETYVCEVVKDTPIGQVRASRTLDGEMRLVGSSAFWRSTNDIPSGLLLDARWFSEGPTEVNFSTGVFAASIDVTAPARRKLLEGKKFSFEITTLVTSNGYTVGGIRNAPRHWREFASDHRENFITGWADVFAMSKGTNHLNIVARDGKNQALASWAFDSAILVEVLQQARELSEEARTMSTSDIDKCDHSSDQEILL